MPFGHRFVRGDIMPRYYSHLSALGVRIFATGVFGAGEKGGAMIKRWNDVPRGTTDEVSSHVRLDLPSVYRQGRHLDRSTSSSNPMMEGPQCRFRREARARERH